MEYESRPPSLSILHVLTLNGKNGEYGGPVRVARELCTELNLQGFETHIFSGAIQGSEPVSKEGLSESFIYVKPLTEKFRVSSLWSWKLIKPLNQLIKESDLVHIHFARDLIPFLTGMLSVINRKPFVAQTHGMIIFDGRFTTRIVDFLLTKPLINKSRRILVLTEMELSDARRLNLKPEIEILPNGIVTDVNTLKIEKSEKRIIFCSRLEKRKGVEKFIELASRLRGSSLKFEIYGPDGGELDFVLSEIDLRKLGNSLEYKGAIWPFEVQQVLRNASLLVLPSKNEPFPMIVLEALSVGTPVLVMPSCGIARQLSTFCEHFVATEESTEGLVKAVRMLSLEKELISKTKIIEFCRLEFSIERVTRKLISQYELVLENEMEKI